MKPKTTITSLVFFLTSFGFASGELLVYEPFDYPKGPLNGQGGALGTSGTWATTEGGFAEGWWVYPEGETSGTYTSTGFPNIFDGTIANLPTKGGFAGTAGPVERGQEPGTRANGGNLDGSIALDPSVTASFQPGTTTWFSYIGGHADNLNQGSPQFMLASDPTTPSSRGLSLTNSGSGIGATGGPPRFNLHEVYPQYFSGGVNHQSPGGYQDEVFGGHNGIVTGFCSTPTCNGGLVEVGEPRQYTMSWQVSNDEGFGAPNIIVGKIEWDADTEGEDVISVVRFLETDEVSEEAFNARIEAQPKLSSRNWTGNKPDLDQSQFTLINISSVKFFIDEIRIGTTFESLITPVVDPVDTFALTITPATAPDTGYDLEWESETGKLYNLLTSTDLGSPVPLWDMVAGDIEATPPSNVFNVDPEDSRRFYAVERFDAPPPPPLLSSTFEEGDDGFTVAPGGTGSAWQHGKPDSPDLGGGFSVDSGNTNNPDSTEGAWSVNRTGAYASNTETALRSPVIDLTEISGAQLSFARVVDIASGDSLVVRVIEDDGDEMLGDPLFTINGPISSDWDMIGPFDFPEEALNRAVRIEWHFTGTDEQGFFLGAYLDDVLVTPTQ